MRLAWDGRTRNQLLRGALVLCEVVVALLIAHPTSSSAGSPVGSADRFFSDPPQSSEGPAQSQVLSQTAPSPPYDTPTPAQAPPPTIAATQPLPTSSPTPAPSPEPPLPTATAVIVRQAPAAAPTPVSPPPTPVPSPPTPTSAPPTDAPPTSARACEQQLIAVVNQFRIDNGVPPLLHNPLLSAAAQQYADIVASQGILSHTADGRTLDARVETAGYSDWIALGENIAGGYATAEEALKGWLASAPHRHNLLSPAFTETGVGCAWNPDSAYGYFWVQDFGAR